MFNNQNPVESIPDSPTIKRIKSCLNLPQIMDRVKILENRLLQEKNRNDALEARLLSMDKYVKDSDVILGRLKKDKIRMDSFRDSVYDLEHRVSRNEQYTRHENLIISNIPSSIKQNDLEIKVLDILHTIGLHQISSYNITACHRLVKRNRYYPADVIVRFVNRKTVDFCYVNSNKLFKCSNILGLANLSFREDMCHANENIFAECIYLKNYGVVEQCYTRNGKVKIIIKNENHPLIINHIDDLGDIFREFYIYEYLYDK